MTDEQWYRRSVIECPMCGHLQNDYINKSESSWSGCREHYRSKCEKCGFNGWVPERVEYGIPEY